VSGLVDEALGYLNERGAVVMNVAFLQHAAGAALTLGRVEEAEARLAAYAPHIDSLPRLDSSAHVRLRCRLAWARGDDDLALDLAQRDVDVATRLGNPLNLGQAHIVATLALLRAKSASAAADYWRDVGVSRSATPMISAGAGLVDARLAIALGDTRGAIDASRKALRQSRDAGVLVPIAWPREDLCQVYGFALAHGIEPGFVAEVIARQQLATPVPADAPAAWPWPIRIRCLGGWQVDRAGQGVVERPAAPGPLQRALLMLLIARRGRPISPQRAAELLWPEADGDRAAQSLRSTLRRVRQGIPDADALRVTADGIALDPAVCWVDAWSLLRLTELGGPGAEGPDADALIAAAASGDGVFVGADYGWARGFFAELGQAARSAALAVASSANARGDHAHAASILEHGLALDDGDERLYRALMTTQAAAGELASVARTYERCLDVLRRGFEIAPSVETRSLYERLVAPG
jgi:DNA-binding SARP family transcriptional activator